MPIEPEKPKQLPTKLAANFSKPPPVLDVKPLPTDSFVRVEVTEASSPSDVFVVVGDNLKVLDAINSILKNVDKSRILSKRGQKFHYLSHRLVVNNDASAGRVVNLNPIGSYNVQYSFNLISLGKFVSSLLK